MSGPQPNWKLNRQLMELNQAGWSTARLGARFGISKQAVANRILRAKRGQGPRVYPMLPLPDDFAKWAKRENMMSLRARYRRAETVIRRWLKESGLKLCGLRRSVPADIEERAKEMHPTALARHYDCDIRLLRRWLGITGVKPIAYQPPPAQPRPQARVAYIGPKIKMVVPPRDGSLHGDAADHLRRYAPVHRCDERGQFAHDGDFWRYGNAILTPDDLLRRAEAKGWQAERWAA
jgi:hypothetical protein